MEIPTTQVFRICAVSERTFYRWLKFGLIAGVPPRIKGSQYPPFSPRQVTFVRLAKAMRRHHFALDDIRDALAVLDLGWNGAEPALLLADPLGWTFGQRFLVELDGQLEPLMAAPPVLWDVGSILAGVLVELEEWEANQEEV